MLLCSESIHASCSISSYFQEPLLTEICCISVAANLHKCCLAEWLRAFALGADEAAQVPQSSPSIFLF